MATSTDNATATSAPASTTKAENAAPTGTATATDPATSADKSDEKSGRKRRWKQQDGARKKRKKVQYVREVQLHKGNNLILVSCQKYKERICGRDLKLQLNEVWSLSIKSPK